MSRTQIINNLYSNKEGGFLERAPLDLQATFAEDAFDITVMRAKLPKAVYKSIKSVVDKGGDLDEASADTIANAMKEWALSKGCTHYTHWFSPLRATTAEKHDSFLEVSNGKPIMEFSGALLIRGEPDASSFPNGGTRETSQARGYTAWDPSTPVFIRNNNGVKTLTIPTVFCSWTGEALDMKIPLLRSVEALSREAIALMNDIGENKKGATSVYATLGCEQEFFLVDQQWFKARPDLYTTGRTVIGAAPAKGQDAEDHYFGITPARVIACIHDAEEKLWKLGIPTKTRHNEVAPSQFEMAPIFERADTAADHNLLVMEVLEQTAREHGLECLMHEKPFANLNGSGKHNNWSIATNRGENLLEPTATPSENIRFIVFLTAVIKAVDEHADLMRASIAVPGNDHRLGAQEAPPAIISIYLGEMLHDLVTKLIGDAEKKGFEGKKAAPGTFVRAASEMDMGASVLPKFKRDPTDRNRTSPFAFTGNKFEFRAVGSSQNVAIPCMVMNTVTADAISKVRAEINAAKAANGGNTKAAVTSVVKATLAAHYKVVFEGNGYGAAWLEEAKRRGLRNYPTTPEALSHLTDQKNVDLFQKFSVLNAIELTARKNIWLEHYSTTLLIEARIAASLVQGRVLPAGLAHQKNVADSIVATKAVSADIALGETTAHFTRVAGVTEAAQKAVNELKAGLKVAATKHVEGKPQVQADFIKDNVIPKMASARAAADEIEMLVADGLWTLPTYDEITMLK